MLKFHGFDATATTPTDAFGLLQSQQYALIIIDAHQAEASAYLLRPEIPTLIVERLVLPEDLLRRVEQKLMLTFDPRE